MSEIPNSYMYTVHMSPLIKGRIDKQLRKLIRFEGKAMSYAEFIAVLAQQGFRPRSRQYTNRNGNSATEYAMMENHEGYSLPNKTLYDFACYLVEQDAVTKKSQQLLRNREAAHYENIRLNEARQKENLEAAKRANEEESRALDVWISEEAQQYQSDSRLETIREIFTEMHGQYDYSHTARLLVLIDHISAPRVCERLCESLHPMNKASRKAFTAITGNKLPRGNHATRIFLGEYSCSIMQRRTDQDMTWEGRK